MNHFEFKKKYILLLYQTQWKFIDSPAVLKFSHRFEVASNNPILSPGKIINIPYGELTFNIAQTIIRLDGGIIINLPPSEMLFGYSLPRLRIGHDILLNLLNSPCIMNIFYSKPAGDIGHAEAISAPNWQVISQYNTISILTGVSKFITISPELIGSFTVEDDLNISNLVALSMIWTWPTNNMFIVDILVGSGKNLVISYLQASVNYSTIISIYKTIYISYYDDGSLLSDIENTTLEDFSYKQFTP